MAKYETEYNIKPDPDNGIVCACCGHERAMLHKFKCGPGQDGSNAEGHHGQGEGYFNYLCHMCSATYLSHHVTYLRLYGEHHHLFSSIGWIANELSLKLEDMKAEISGRRH